MQVKPAPDTPSQDTKTAVIDVPQRSIFWYLKKLILTLWKAYHNPKLIIKTIIVIAILGILSGVISYLVETGLFLDLMKWVQRHKYDYGLLIMFAGFVGASFPVSGIFTLFGICCGYIYGMGIGYGITVAMCLFSAIASYVPYKYWGRTWIQNKIKKQPVLQHVDKMIEKNGLKFVFLIRVAPIPFGYMNALSAPAKVNFFVYLVGALAEIAYEQAIYNYTGASVKSIQDAVGGNSLSPAQIGLLCFQCVLVCIFFAVSFWVGKKAYDKVHAMEKADGLEGKTEEDDEETTPQSITES